MMIFLIALALLALIAVVMAVREIAHDGYRAIPTRPGIEEMLPRYR